MAVTVATFGVHYRWALPRELTDQLWLAHRLRCDLVESQITYEADLKTIWSSYPDVQAAEQAIAAAELSVETALDLNRAAKITQRTKRVTGTSVDDLKTAKASLRDAREARRKAITASRLAAAPKITWAAASLKTRRKALYARYCQAGDLYWATFNDVAGHHDTAVKLIQRARAAGKPAILKYHRFDGTGTIAVQLQRAAGESQRTPALLADPTGRYRNVIALPWVNPDQWDHLTRAEQRHQGRVTVRMFCGTTHLELPIQAHDMLPADADVTGARLTVARYGTDLRATLTVTAKLPDPARVSNGPTVAVHLGWRESTTGTATVGRWSSNRPLLVPADLRDVIQPVSSTRGTIVAPVRVFTRLEEATELQAQRALHFNETTQALADWLDQNPGTLHPGTGDPLTAAIVSRWRSPARVVGLTHLWTATPPVGSAALLDTLNGFVAADRIDWTREDRLRAKATRQRQDGYRRAAAWISGIAGLVVVDTMNVATLSALPTDLPERQTQPAALRRTWAAPGSLREAIVQGSARDGVDVEHVEAAGISSVHAACGHTNPRDDRWLNQIVPCDGCGQAYDQDENALTHLHARAAIHLRAAA